MITGVVKSDEGRIRLKVKGLRAREQEVEAVLDTGYTASLTLPSLTGTLRSARMKTRLPRRSTSDMRLYFIGLLR